MVFTVFAASTGGAATLYIGALVRGAFRREFARAWLFAIPAALSLLLGGSELFAIFTGHLVLDTSTTAFVNTPPILFTVLFLVLRLLDGPSEANTLNLQLDRRVAERTGVSEGVGTRVSLWIHVDAQSSTLTSPSDNAS